MREGIGNLYFNSLSEREQALLISVNDLIAYPVSVQTTTGARVA